MSNYFYDLGKKVFLYKQISGQFIKLCILTLGTNISNILRKQQNITAKDMNANEASCCDAITIATGAVIKHRTTTLYMLIPTYRESLICFTFIDLVSYARNRPKTNIRPLKP